MSDIGDDQIRSERRKQLRSVSMVLYTVLDDKCAIASSPKTRLDPKTVTDNSSLCYYNTFLNDNFILPVYVQLVIVFSAKNVISFVFPAQVTRIVSEVRIVL